MFARLKRTNASARKYSNCCAVHSAVYIEPREASRGGREQNFPLTNAAGLCRAAGELPARETIRRKKEMERESNYPSAKTDTSPNAGLNPDVGSEVCVDWSYGGAGKRAPGGPLWDGRWLSAYHGELGKTRSHMAVFAGDAASCLAPRGSTLQLGTAVSCLGGGGLWAELCRCKRRRVNAWHPLSRPVSVKWAGGASPGMREGMWRSLCASAISRSMHKHRASRYCGVTARGQLTAGREGGRLEPGGLSAGWRPAGDP